MVPSNLRLFASPRRTFTAAHHRREEVKALMSDLQVLALDDDPIVWRIVVGFIKHRADEVRKRLAAQSAGVTHAAD